VKAKYEKTDAKFSCPASVAKLLRCNARKLTYDEYFIGICCENAALWTYKEGKFFRQMVVQHIYDDARTDEDSAETVLENAVKNVAEAKLVLKKAEETEANAVKSLDEKKEWRKTVQKRALFLAKEAMKEDNSDLETDEEMKNSKKKKIDEEEDKLTCKICLEKFDDEHIEAAIIPCGHKFCYRCLDSIAPYNCPTCRAKFTMRKVYKLY